MLFESKNAFNPKAEEDFNWVLTRFAIFELENSLHTLPNDEIYKIEKLIKFHETLENFEICRKLLTYKEICLTSNTK